MRILLLIAIMWNLNTKDCGTPSLGSSVESPEHNWALAFIHPLNMVLGQSMCVCVYVRMCTHACVWVFLFVCPPHPSYSRLPPISPIFSPSLLFLGSLVRMPFILEHILGAYPKCQALLWERCCVLSKPKTNPCPAEPTFGT